MFKWLFPLFFLIFAATAQAQPQPPSGPLYDPQGRLIPYDPPTEVNEAPRPASKPKASTQKKSGTKSATPAKGKSKKASAKKSKSAAKSAAGKKKSK